MERQILQIVPRLPPSLCGVGDQATILAGELRDGHDIKSRFLVCDPSWTPSPVGFDFECHHVKARTSHSLQTFLEKNAEKIEAIIVQYSGYGFASRGAPVWLANGLSSWRRLHPKVALVSMYHELFSSGRVTTSSFWLQPLQKWVVRKLAKTSTSVRTNRAAYQEWLARSLQIPIGDVVSMPVFSNFGETSDLTHLGSRRNQLVVQGLGRTGDLAQSLANLQRLVTACGTEQIKVIGSASDAPIPSDLKLEYTGHLSNEGVSRLLKESRRGYVDYYPGYLGKSSIHAAYCAHGLATYTFGQPDDNQDGIRHGLQFFDLAREEKLPDAKKEIRLGEQAHSWYQGHNIRATAHSYADQLRKPC